MAHYALLNSANVVFSVIGGKDETDVSENWEEYYGNFHNCTVKRTSYNTLKNSHSLGGVAFRGNYAGIDYTYYEDVNYFMPPKPYNSWSMSTADATWIAPSAMPTDGNPYSWDEDNQTWIDISGSSAGGV
tara:strand:- start:162 stop:551 length:390 start_codon:yes stop_codon:yes gene_type:complete